jgi:imidazolonepropionase-like amidohydrolase
VDLLAHTGAWLTTTVKLNERVVELTQSSDTLRTRPEMRYVHPYTLVRWLNHNQYIATPQHLPRRQQIVEFNRALIRAMVDADLPFVVGTDSLVTGNVPGFALHDELVALVAAGAPPALVLHSATRRPAQWLGVLRDRGTVERGKRADLLLLDADPLIDISNTRRIVAVIAGGRYLSRQSLDTMMEQLAARYAAMRIPDAATTVNGQFEGHND